jgi:hypothetical protein
VVEEEWRSVHFELDFFNFSILIFFCVCGKRGIREWIWLLALVDWNEWWMYFFRVSLTNRDPHVHYSEIKYKEKLRIRY